MGILFIILIVILAIMSPYILTAINICCIFNPKKPICGISWGLTFIMGPVVGAYYFEMSEGQNDLWASQIYDTYSGEHWATLYE